MQLEVLSSVDREVDGQDGENGSLVVISSINVEKGTKVIIIWKCTVL